LLEDLLLDDMDIPVRPPAQEVRSRLAGRRSRADSSGVD
jgi:hypothetical protein